MVIQTKKLLNKEITNESISFILPCLNEEESIEFCINDIKQQILNSNLQYEIIIVDNGSTDNSQEIARNNGAKVVNEVKRGYGNALKRGFKEAKGDIIVMLDSDGSYGLEELNNMISMIMQNKADFVIGDRLNGKIEKGAMPWLHKNIGNPFLTYVLNKIYRMNIADTHCGFRVFDKKLIGLMNLETTGMEFASEMLIKLSVIENVRITQIPISFRQRKGGKPHLRSFRDGWRHLKFLIKKRNLH